MSLILTCTDGSVYAESVYDHSAWAARKMDAQIHVLHMLEPPREQPAIGDLSGMVGPDGYSALLNQMVTVEEERARLDQVRGKAILAEAQRYLSDKQVKEVNVQQLQGELVDMVEEFDEKIDLVVIGKRGEAADFARLHLGSNLERVIRASHHPVLVASRNFEPIDSFLLAYDASPSAKKALEYAVREPLLRGLKCHLITAGTKERDKAELRVAKQQLEAAGYEVDASCIDGDTVDVIAEQVNQRGAGLLVMGAYGHSQIRQLILGSATTQMVRTCLVPVLMFR